MARFVASSLAFFAFALSIIGGVIAGNPASEVLSRAIFALFLFFLLGLMLGGAAQLVVSEYARQQDAATEAFRERLAGRKPSGEASEASEAEAPGMA